MKTYIVICDIIEHLISKGSADIEIPRGSADLNEVIGSGVVFNSDVFGDLDVFNFVGKATFRNDETATWRNPNGVLRAEFENVNDAVDLLQWIAEHEGEVMPGMQVGDDYINRYLYTA